MTPAHDAIWGRCDPSWHRTHLWQEIHTKLIKNRDKRNVVDTGRRSHFAGCRGPVFPGGHFLNGHLQTGEHIVQELRGMVALFNRGKCRHPARLDGTDATEKGAGRCRESGYRQYNRPGQAGSAFGPATLNLRYPPPPARRRSLRPPLDHLIDRLAPMP